MIRWLFVVLAAWPTVAAAQSITVQSGEHADFSRLVILTRDLPEWQFGRVEDGYELRTDATDWAYDLARVFDLIPKKRIAAISDLGEGRLRLTVNCECHADAFEIRSGLVIDIKDGAAPATARFEEPLAKITPKETADHPVFPSDPVDIFALPSLRAQWPAPTQDSPTQGLAATPPDSHDTQNRVIEAQAALLEQLSRAAGQGLITPSAGIAPTPVTERPAPTTVQNEPMEKDPADTVHMVPDSSVETEAVDIAPDVANIRVTSAVEVFQSLQSDPEPLTSEGENCRPDDHFAIADWGVPIDSGATFSDFRAQIVGEFDSADPESVEALVKYYIYLTFGAEARALLSAFDTEIPDAGLLHSLAEIMDNGVASNQRPLIDELGCETSGALWAVLARPSLGRGDRVPVDAVIAAFAAMPLHLRRHLGPGLAERFLTFGDTDTATAIRNAIARAPGDHGEALTLLDAELALMASAGDAGGETLPKLVASGGDIAPRALVRLLDATLDKGGDFAPSLIETAAALAFEHRGTPLGSELARVHIRSLVHAGQYKAATEAMDSSAKQDTLDSNAIDLLNQELFIRAAQHATPSDFLTLVLSRPTGDGEGAQADTARHSVAERLLDLGFAKEARDLLAEDTAVPTSADRILFARSFLLNGQPDLAIGYLVGLDDPAAKALLGRAHEDAGSHESAARVYASIQDSEAEARAIWRSENWNAARQLGSDARKAAAELATQVAAPDEELPTLARTKALIDQSASARDILRALLNEPAPR